MTGTASGGRLRANLAGVVAHARRAAVRRARPPRRLDAMVVSAGAVSLVLAAAILAVGFDLDRRSIALAQDSPAPVIAFFALLSELGRSYWTLVPSGLLVLLLCCGDWRRVEPRTRAAWAEIGALAAFIFGAVGGAAILVNIAKELVGRGRPQTFAEVGWLSFEPFRFDWTWQSFPSGHSTTAGALLVIGALVFPRWQGAFLAFGLGVAISRVFVGAHYPSDIVAGLAVGILFSLWLAAMFRRYGWGFARQGPDSIRARTAALRRLLARPRGGRALLAALGTALSFRQAPIRGR